MTLSEEKLEFYGEEFLDFMDSWILGLSRKNLSFSPRSLSFQPYIIKLIGFCEKPRCIVTKLYDCDLTHFLHSTPCKEIPSKLRMKISYQLG